MEKIPENLDSQLEQLLIEKGYEELSEAEMIWVAARISTTDYAAFRKILLSSKSIFQQSNASPDPSVKAALLQQLKARKAKPNYWEQLKTIIYHPIPSWKVALAFFALCVGFWFYQNKLAKQATDSLYVNQATEFSEQVKKSQKDSLAKVVNYKSRSVGAEQELKQLFRGVY